MGLGSVCTPRLVSGITIIPRGIMPGNHALARDRQPNLLFVFESCFA